MVLKSLILKNFRAYKDMEINFDNNMNVIIGQNDIGKSTILEALDIFFEGNIINIEGSDLYKELETGFIEIGVEFLIDNSKEITIDTTYKTTPKKEFLLNQVGNLEIIKKWEIKNKDSKVGKPKIYLKSFYPKIEKNIISLKNFDLKKELKKLYSDTEYKEKNKGSNALIREAIYEKLNCYTETIEKELLEIDMEKDGGKDIWTSFVQNELPLYFLFQSDRANKDSDGDIQHPLKTATKKIVAEFEDEFKKIKEGLEEKLNQIGIDTIDKMKDMGLDVADSLTPKVRNKNLDTLFSFTLESDDGIALNKRGSGFRRMVMLNYFRAEAERKIIEKNNKNVIYSIEEPETAQHPNHQKMLIKALLELSNKDNHQVIITTHTPEIAKMVNENNLMLIDKDEDKNPIVIENNENKISSIIQTLGILPNINIQKIQKIKVVVCFEGYTDVKFIENINENIEEFKNTIDVSDDSVLLLPLGGSALQHYVNYNYLDKLNVPQLHIYDSDYNQQDIKIHYQYKKYIDEIILKDNSNYGFMTEKAEIENYIHPKLIKDCYKIDTCFHDGVENWLETWSKSDLSVFINNNTDKSDPNIEPISSKRMSKKHLCIELSKKLTKEHLIELEAFDEIKGWFEKIRELSE